jgi:hypothetical protein
VQSRTIQGRRVRAGLLSEAAEPLNHANLACPQRSLLPASTAGVFTIDASHRQIEGPRSQSRALARSSAVMNQHGLDKL